MTNNNFVFEAGVDEAGRGPVIGPMVMAIAVIDQKDINILRELGVKDSKLLTEKKREELYPKLLDISIENYTVSVSASQIDDLREIMSLNELEANMCSNLVNMLKSSPKAIYIDCPDINPKSYQNKVLRNLNEKHNLVCEHKADYKYISTGVASIIAKVQRDKSISEIEQKLGIKVGSGYPSDPYTKKFLRENLNNKDVQKYIRKSWQTYIDLKESGSQRTLF